MCGMSCLLYYSQKTVSVIEKFRRKIQLFLSHLESMENYPLYNFVSFLSLYSQITPLLPLIVSKADFLAQIFAKLQNQMIWGFPFPRLPSQFLSYSQYCISFCSDNIMLKVIALLNTLTTFHYNPRPCALLSQTFAPTIMHIFFILLMKGYNQLVFHPFHFYILTLLFYSVFPAPVLAAPRKVKLNTTKEALH